MNNEKYVLITGSTSGIGMQTAKDLQNKGYHVFGTSRSEDKEITAKAILGDNFTFIRGNLSSKKSLEIMSGNIREYLNGNKLYALVNNAGTFFSKHTLNEDGVEMQFAVNTVAPLYLSLLLYSEFDKENGRIINVNSSSHFNTIINWRDIQLNKSYGQLRAYKQTKALSVLLSRAFNNHSKNVKMYMADPGLVSTDIGFKNTSGLSRIIWSYRKSIGQTTKQGAATSVYLVDSKTLPQELYYKDCKIKSSSYITQNTKYAERIWDYVIKLYNIEPKDYIKG